MRVAFARIPSPKRTETTQTGCDCCDGDEVVTRERQCPDNPGIVLEIGVH